ncbi:MAG: hypothetical protein HY924_06750 [Elusimicrobia bacterium]|nr:hypothetical protein [Elusimicrobiota bacterium]
MQPSPSVLSQNHSAPKERAVSPWSRPVVQGGEAQQVRIRISWRTAEAVRLSPHQAR